MIMNNIDLFTKVKLGVKYPKSAVNFMRTGFIDPRKDIVNFPRIISIFITNKCNLACSFCLNSIYRTEHIKGEEVSIEQINKLLPELKKHKPFVYFIGGEPLIAKGIFDAVRLLSSNGIFTALTTNGFNLAKNIDNVIESGLEFISLSLDNYKIDMHNQERGNSQSFNKLINGIELLVKARKKTPSNIKINTAITKNNFNDLVNMFKFIENLGVDEWSLQHFSYITPDMSGKIKEYEIKHHIGSYKDGTLINEDTYLNKDEVYILKDQLSQIKILSENSSLNIKIKPNIDDLESYYSGKFPGKNSSCTMPFETINILENGKITSCLGYQLGDIDTMKSLEHIWKLDQTDRYKSRIKKGLMPGCFRCCALDYKFN